MCVRAHMPTVLCLHERDTGLQTGSMISVLALGSSEPLRPLQNNVPGSSISFPSSEHAQQGLVKVLVGARDQRNTSKSHS